MQNVTIISHLAPEEWRRSWMDKVVEDSPENKRKYQQSSCYWGHFTSDSDFTICHHKEYEIKGMSLSLYFRGHLETDEQGSRITGTFGKKLSANIFLAMGAVICILVLFSAAVKADYEILITAAVLLAILFAVYFTKPQKVQQNIFKMLEKISFDDTYHRRSHMPKKPKKTRRRDISNRDSENPD